MLVESITDIDHYDKVVAKATSSNEGLYCI